MESDEHESSSLPCNLCGGTQISVLARRSRSGKPLRTVICRRCGLVWSDPRPHDPRTFYEADYRLSYKGTWSPKPKHVLRAGRVAISRHAKVAALLPRPKSILDVGSGGGEFAYLLACLGHHVVGVEPNKGYADYSIAEYGLDVRGGFIQDVELPAGHFDLITVWHVLEHTENPLAVLAKLRTLLKPDGMLVVEVPNIEATCQSPNSTFHEAHLFNFNGATLRAMVAKAGFLAQDVFAFGDKGNITMFTRPVQTFAECRAGIPRNAERVAAITRRHTRWRHFLRLTPYLRFLRRLAQWHQERRGTRRFSGGKRLLDDLYRTIV